MEIKKEKMGKPKTFVAPDYGTLKVIYYKNQSWYRLKDVIRILHYNSIDDAMKAIEDVTNNTILSPDSVYELVRYISQFAVIDLLIDSNPYFNNPEYVDDFSKWVTEINSAMREANPEIKALEEITINGIAFREIDSLNYPQFMLDKFKIININGVNYIPKVTIDMKKEKIKEIDKKYKEIIDMLKEI